VHRVFEVVFRHPFRLLSLIVLLPLLSVAVVFFLPRTYHATGTLLAVARYQVSGATGAESNLQDSPAGTQASAMNELLQTQEFDLAVAKETGLAATLPASERSDPQTTNQAIFDDISKHAIATPVAYSTYSVVYTNKSAQVSRDVVAAIIDQFGTQGVAFSVLAANNLIASDTATLKSYTTNLQAARTAEAQYVSSHPRLQNNPVLLQNDAQYLQDDAARQQWQTAVDTLNGQVQALQQEIDQLSAGGAAALYLVLDKPQVPDKPDSRTKDFVLGGVLGLVLALLIGTLAIVFSLRRDHSIYRPADLAKVTDLPVIMQVPHLTRREIRTSSLLPGAHNAASTSKRVPERRSARA
jgi:hypothetical protein